MHLEEKSGEAQKVKQEIKMMEEDLVRAKD